MKEFEKIVEYHLDNNLRSVSPKFNNKLTAKQHTELMNIINLNNHLTALRVKNSFGEASFRSVLNNIDTEAKPASKGLFRSFKFAGSVFAIAAVIAIGGGFGLQNVNNSSKQSASLNTSKVAANGSVDNLNNLNLADAQNDINLASESKLDQTVATEIKAQSNVDEAINENF